MTGGAAPSIRQEADSTLAVCGQVTADNVVVLRSEGERWLGSLGREVEINLAGVENAHSIVLSLLLCWQRAAKACNQNLIYSGISERMLSLCALSGLSQHLPSFHHPRPVAAPDL